MVYKLNWKNRHFIHDLIVDAIFNEPGIINLYGVEMKEREPCYEFNGCLWVKPDLLFQTSEGIYIVEVKTSIKTSTAKKKASPQYRKLKKILSFETDNGFEAVFRLVHPTKEVYDMKALLRYLHYEDWKIKPL
ncbi:MAG: hypothetical protein DRP15_00485 [Candidatus Aenigmatarchaeota archaeon]|nr:MAG: hypothetical protein DRP15_00485 [Candidatus Aenigmarchaeota archaeon]